MKQDKDPKKPSPETPSPDSEEPFSITEDLQEEFLRFMEFHPARRFSRNLRKMLLEFMTSEGALEAVYMKDLLYDMDGLFDLLDAIHEVQGDMEE